MAKILRLTAADAANLATEAADTPMHQAVLAVLAEDGLRDAAGRLRIEVIRAHFLARLARLPELRRRLRHTALLEGPDLWEDDPAFRIEDHVRLARLAAPGGMEAALAYAEGEMSRLMDRSRPLWEVSFLDGFGEGKVAVLMKLHHALADGPAMVNMLAQVFDLEPRPFENDAATWSPAPAATARELMADNARRKLGAVARAAGAFAHPLALGRKLWSTLGAFVEGSRQGRGAPRTSLNRPIQSARRIGSFEVDLAAAKAVAHGRGVKLNDVFLAGVAAAVRRTLLSRGEDVYGRRLRASMAVSMRSSGDAHTTGNRVGTEVVALPLDVADAGERLRQVAAATTRAKSAQLPVVSSGLMVTLAKTGIARLFIRHQHLINVLTTNLPGPPVPLYFARARIEHAVAIPPIAGNVTVSFAALSYAGHLNYSLIADAASWPDFAVLVDGIAAGWHELEAPPAVLARSA